MRKIWLLLVVLSLALLLVSSHAVKAQAPPSFPTIVVFDENANLNPYAAEFAPDDRAAANPPAWGYLNRGVAGYVQRLERLMASRPLTFTARPSAVLRRG